MSRWGARAVRNPPLGTAPPERGRGAGGRRWVWSPLLVVVTVANAVQAAGPGANVWERLALPLDGVGVALDVAPDRRLAVADMRGVWLGQAGRIQFARVVRERDIRDLAFTEDGTLWVGAGGELLASPAEAGGTLRRVPLGTGVDRIARLSACRGRLLVTTEQGAFVGGVSQPFVALREGLPRAPVEVGALRCGPARDDGRSEAWLASDGALWRVVLDESRVVEVRRFQPNELLGEPIVDLVPDAGGVELAVVTSRGVIVARGVAEPTGQWRLARGRGPAGAELSRLRFAANRFWIATPRGLLVADDLDAPWHRAEPPLGGDGASALAVADETLFVAAASGVWSRELGETARGTPRVSRAWLSEQRDPPIDRVRQAALRYLALGPDRIRRLRRGVDRRGWLPTLDLRFTSDFERQRAVDRDEAFLSGDFRNLVDRDLERGRGLSASLTLSWELGDVLYHPEAIDLSREAREVIELRDDILDEIAQLYFERQRVLLELAARDQPADEDAWRLVIRAQELAAGIDAWTGGWFGPRARPALPPSFITPGSRRRQP